MGLLDGMKDKLGFGSKPEWQSNESYDSGSDTYDDGYDNAYGDSYGSTYGDEGGMDSYGSPTGNMGGVVSFDDYNPNNFEHVTLSSDRAPRVASYDNLGSSSFGSSRTSSSRSSSSYGSSNVRSIGSRSSSRSTSASSAAMASSWSSPEDPSFLDAKAPSYSRSLHTDSKAGDLYSSLGSDFIKASKDPATRMSIVRPRAYADVEKIANAAKAGKSVVLVVAETKPAIAKRILDFSFGVASALNLNVDKAADRVFVISKGSEPLSESEREYLQGQGVLK